MKNKIYLLIFGLTLVIKCNSQELKIGNQKIDGKLTVNELEIAVSKKNTPISGLNIAVQSFVTSENAAQSYYLKMRDLGAPDAPDAFIIKGNRNVGINISNPLYRLDVNGTSRFNDIILPNGNQLSRNLNDNFTFKNLSFGNYSLGWISDPSFPTAGSLWMSGFGGIKLFTAKALRLAILNNGNVGIGTENPQNKLDVNGTARFNDIILPNGNQLSRNLNDNFTFKNLSFGNYSLGWISDPSFPTAGSLWMSGFGGIKLFTAKALRLTILNNGYVGIGTENPQNKLDVAGTIRATEVKVEALPWPDFVFDKEYKLPSLKDVESHIDEHKHLPGIPSESEVIENGGVGLGEMQVKLLQKIEELTLYVIEQNKKIERQNDRIKELEYINSLH